MFGERNRSIYRSCFEHFDVAEKFMYFKSKGKLEKTETKKNGTEIYQGVGRKWFVKDGECYTVRYLKA